MSSMPLECPAFLHTAPTFPVPVLGKQKAMLKFIELEQHLDTTDQRRLQRPCAWQEHHLSLRQKAHLWLIRNIITYITVFGLEYLCIAQSISLC